MYLLVKKVYIIVPSLKLEIKSADKITTAIVVGTDMLIGKKKHPIIVIKIKLEGTFLRITDNLLFFRVRNKMHPVVISQKRFGIKKYAAD